MESGLVWSSLAWKDGTKSVTSACWVAVMTAESKVQLTAESKVHLCLQV
jgi:hypothetical protein